MVLSAETGQKCLLEKHRDSSVSSPGKLGKERERGDGEEIRNSQTEERR